MAPTFRWLGIATPDLLEGAAEPPERPLTLGSEPPLERAPVLVQATLVVELWRAEAVVPHVEDAAERVEARRHIGIRALALEDDERPMEEK